ncbi:MAG: NUDIX hydrolase [Bacteriovoracaceae bacterium]|jgi:ADP-ribose pyrophosphatase|nr:NUDIX hydrolase [Bacteriovoracaceae bacterium]
MIKKWKVLEREDISPSKWFPLEKQKVQLPSGTLLDDYYIGRLGNVAMIIPVTSEGEIVFVKQYKNGVGEIALELPAGYIEKDQTPLEAAQAELAQETGIESPGIEYIGELWTSPTKIDTKVFGFIVKDAVITCGQNLDVTEEIEIKRISIKKELDQYILSGEINCSDTLALLHLAKIKYPQIFSR